MRRSKRVKASTTGPEALSSVSNNSVIHLSSDEDIPSVTIKKSLSTPEEERKHIQFNKYDNLSDDDPFHSSSSDDDKEAIHTQLEAKGLSLVTSNRNPFADLPTSVQQIPSSPDWSTGSFQEHTNLVSNIDPTSRHLIWRATNKTNSFYMLYEKCDDVKIRPQKILIPGVLGNFVDLLLPSQYGRWQVKLSVDDTVWDQINALLSIGPFTVERPRELNISLKTNDKDLDSDVDREGSFPYLYDGRVSFADYTEFELGAGEFTEGTEVVIECVFTAWSMRQKTGYSWKLLAVIRAFVEGRNDLIVDSSLLFPQKKEKETI